MKRCVISVVILAVVLALVLPLAVGADEDQGRERAGNREGRGGREGRGRRGFMGRERQNAAIEAIEAELAKMKKAFDAFSGGREQFRNLSEEKRNELREKFRKIRQQRQESIATIENQLVKLKGPRQFRQAHEKEIEQLNTLLELARKDDATNTIKGVERLIAEKTKAFEEKLKKLGLEGRAGRGRRNREGRERGNN